jgi:alkylation response protein AidB-like acyl-CoA dehydrogenase
VRAERTVGGWRIDGEAPWITGWGLIDALVVMARAPDGAVVTAVVDRPDAQAALRAGAPQSLAVMGATGTVALGFDGLEVSDHDVVGVQTDDGWRGRDRAGSALPPAAPLGIADRAIGLLRERGSDQSASTVAGSLAGDLDERRMAADLVAESIAGSMAGGGAIDDDLVAAGAAERDRGLDLARRSTDALVAASGGGAMSLEHPAQRLSREATFYLIQAQTADLRVASLARVGHPR